MSRTGINLEIIFGGCTQKGNKSINEDAFSAYLPEASMQQRMKGAIASIADGVGQSQQAHIASQLACENIIVDYYNTPEYWSVKSSASKSIYALNDWFFSQNDHQEPHNTLSDAAYLTTFSCVVIKSNTAHIFHVGDSRVYRFSGDNIELLTTDQSYAMSSSSTYLGQALGLNERLELVYQKVAVEIGDRFLLTTDGVHENLSYQQLRDFCSDTENELEVISEQIVNTALAKNAADNASALLLEVKTLPPLQFSEIYEDFLSLEIPPVLSRNQTIDGYTVIQRLSKEARSLVYLVSNDSDNKQYILKAPAQQYQDDHDYMEGFALEAWIAIELDSPYLMKGHPKPANSEYLYHLSEYIQGKTLKQWMASKGPVSLTEAQAILKAMIKCVAVLHKNNIVHRDLKPENFIFDNNGILKLIDFGTVEIGSLKDDLMVPIQQNPMGDIGYLAPEYMVYGFGSPRSDLFSLATIVYELLTGELPYSAILSNQDNPREFEIWRYRSLLHNKTASPYLPYWVDNVLRKALSPEPEQRYQVLSEFDMELNKPSSESLRLDEQLPLVQRHPLKFYQGLSFVLFVLLIVQFIVFYGN